MLERRTDDYWNIERDRDLSDSWTGFKRFTMLDEKPPDGIHGRLEDARHPGLITCGQRYGKTCRSSATKRKTKMGYRKNEAWPRKKIAQYLLHWSRRCGVQKNYSTCAQKFGRSDASSNANESTRKRWRELYMKIMKTTPDTWIRLPKHKWPKSWSSMGDRVVPSERNLYGHPLAGLLWERKFEESSIWTRLGKVPNWDCLFVNWEEGLLLSVYVDDIKLAGKKQKHWPTVENTCERSRFGRTNILHWPRLFGLHSKRMRNEQRYCGQLQKCLSPESLMERQKSYLVQETWRRHLFMVLWYAKKCVERYCELANKTTQQLYKVTTPCLDDRQFKEEELGSVGELS